MLEARRAEQRSVLEQGADLVKPGGRLAYVTCSVLPSENGDQVDAFLARRPEFKLVPWPELWERSLPGLTPVPSADGSAETLLMTPRDHGTDGFFVAGMQRSH
jgi:16S rRNA (cytosine967-C5)-methyltransferase